MRPRTEDALQTRACRPRRPPTVRSLTFVGRGTALPGDLGTTAGGCRDKGMPDPAAIPGFPDSRDTHYSRDSRDDSRDTH